MIRTTIAIACLAGPAAAETLFAPPQGCEVYVTVQGADCTVEHLMRCAGAPEGQTTAVTIYPSGGDYISIVDAEAQWIYTHDGATGRSETLMEPQADPSSLTDLLDQGRNAYDFTTQSSDGSVTRFVGKEALTGDEITIDGVTLLQTRNEMQAFDQSGEWLWSVVTSEFVSPEWRLFFGGPAQWTTPADGTYPYDGSPVEFIMPGEPGFMSTTPAYGCAG